VNELAPQAKQVGTEQGRGDQGDQRTAGNRAPVSRRGWLERRPCDTSAHSVLSSSIIDAMRAILPDASDRFYGTEVIR